ncbi:flagellar hook-associated protein FlgK [Luteimonas pelagia]
MGDMLSTGTSGLLAFQRALGTIGHNVANATTPGYSRQRVELAARPGEAVGRGYVGAGVEVARLQRLADGLVFARQVDSSGELGRLSRVAALSSRIDALASDPATSMSGPWSAFFAAAQGVATDPTSGIARSQLLADAGQLAQRFRAQDAQLAGLDADVDRQLSSTVADANRLVREIANLNRDIVAAGGNATPDLLDARALRVDQLATLVGVETLAQDDGALNVFTTGGQALVLGQRGHALTATPDPYRPERVRLAIDGPAGAVPLGAHMVSGEVGGLLEFRERVLDPARAALGRVATAVALQANAIQAAGVDAAGNPGAPLFDVPAPRVAAHSGNAGSATLAAGVADVGALQDHDLRLRFDGAAWTASRPDGTAVPVAGTGNAADPLRVAGIALVVSGAPAAGDRFALAPTSGAAGGLQVALADPNGIAAARPLQARAATANLGDAAPGAATVTDPAAFASFAGATVEFIDADQYTIDGNGPFAYTAGTPIAGTGWSLPLSGTPAAGDVFTLARTPPRSSDNGNARDLAALDDLALLDGGTTSLTTGLSQLTARAGGEARHARMSLEAQQAIHDQVVAERESLSGVNLDEEAADLLRFQQAYQAAAQVIATADSMFQSLLGAVRR